jgi:PhnB protein
MTVKPIPDGYHAITPYLVATGIPRLIEFLKDAFGAREMRRSARPDGTVMHAEVSIADSVLMMADATDQYPPRPSTLHFYVADTDAVYQRAVQAGAKSFMEPMDQIYGDRMAGIIDPSGNQWFFATHIEDVADEEITKRMRQRATPTQGD